MNLRKAKKMLVMTIMASLCMMGVMREDDDDPETRAKSRIAAARKRGDIVVQTTDGSYVVLATLCRVCNGESRPKDFKAAFSDFLIDKKEPCKGCANYGYVPTEDGLEYLKFHAIFGDIGYRLLESEKSVEGPESAEAGQSFASVLGGPSRGGFGEGPGKCPKNPNGDEHEYEDDGPLYPTPEHEISVGSARKKKCKHCGATKITPSGG